MQRDWEDLLVLFQSLLLSWEASEESNQIISNKLDKIKLRGGVGFVTKIIAMFISYNPIVQMFRLQRISIINHLRTWKDSELLKVEMEGQEQLRRIRFRVCEIIVEDGGNYTRTN